MNLDTKYAEKQPLLVNKAETHIKVERQFDRSNIKKSNCLYLRFLVTVLFIVCIEVGSLNQTLYIYHRVQETSENDTVVSEVSSNESSTAGPCGKNSSASSEIDSQKAAAKWNWYFCLVENGIAIIPLLIYGIYSDYIGRKPLLIISIFGLFLRYGISGFIVHQNLPLFYFYIAYGVEGLCGCHYTFFLGTMASIADRTEPDKSRSIGLTILESLIGIGGSAGHLIAGYLIKYSGYFYTNIAVASIFLMQVMIIGFFIPDTINTRATKDLSFKSGAKRLFRFYYDKSIVISGETWKFNCIVIAFVSLYFGRTSKGNVETLYQMRSPFCWTSVMIGWYGFIVDIVQFIVGTCIVPIFHMCTNDEVISIFGCLSNIALATIEGLATTSWMLYIAAGTGIISIIAFPVFRSICSRMVPSDLQGALFANLYVLENLVTLLSNSVSNNIYSLTQTIMPGLIFLALPVFFIIPICLVLCVMFCGRKVTKRIR